MNNSTILVGIAGGSASGKSLIFTQNVCAMLVS